MLRESKPGDYELYAAADGVVKITSGVERRILHALQDGDFTYRTILCDRKVPLYTF